MFWPKTFRLFVLLTALTAASRAIAESGVVASWPFDGALSDASPAKHDGKAKTPAFAEGHVGQSLDARGTAMTVVDHPDLRLAAGLMIDCWIRFDRQPTGYQQIVFKDGEYQLRVDGPNEGGRFSFFVHSGGWEPRVTGPIPEPNRWHHLIAQWSGTEAVLNVDGQINRIARVGRPITTTNPLLVGGCTARIDDLKIRNPIMAQFREMRSIAAAATNTAAVTRTTFGPESGWADWRGVGETTVTDQGQALAGRIKGSGALVSPPLSVDVTGRRCVSVELDAPGAKLALLSFLTDAGEGHVTIPLRSGHRTAYADLADCAAWQGKLHLLSLSFPDEQPRNVTLRNLWIDRDPHGRPYLYFRSLSPYRAVLRAGREEKLIAIARNLGVTARAVRARLEIPADLKLIDSAEKSLPDLTLDSTAPAAWRIEAERPGTWPAKVTLTAEGSDPSTRTIDLTFQPPCDLPKASYVPEPIPVKPSILTLMHYCPLWKEGTHYGWEKIEPWPERRPAIGYYDEGTPEVADWHIKYALEHGIQGFIYCWYRNGFDPEIKQSLGHALHDGLFKARYRDRFQFVIMWENGCGTGCRGTDDLLGNLMPYWLQNYFKHPSYTKIDGRPLLYIWVPSNLTRDLGGSENVRRAFDQMRKACRKEGMKGLYIVGCVGTADKIVLPRMAAEGWDASSAYGIIGPTDGEPGEDAEGIPTIDHQASLSNQETIWRGKKEIGALPDIIDVMMGWDPRPWHGPRTARYLAGAAPDHFEAACRKARALIDATPGDRLDKRVVVFDNWNEFGEGHYLEPCAGFGFGFADAIRKVFCDNPPPHQDITPEDVGLVPPEGAYLKRRAILGGFADRPREVKDHLVAAYAFDGDDASVARDSSACAFHALKQDFQSGAGKIGQGFRCDGGTIVVPSHPLFFPREGITVEMWFQADAANQSDRWMLNTVGQSNTGYRLGFGNGRVVWQIPKTSWSHSLAATTPAPLGRWTHVAATYDGAIMRLFIDGVEQGSLQRGGPIAPSGGSLCIGAYGPGNSRTFFQGSIDEVKIWDRALPAEEIRNSAQRNIPPP